jgi:anti-sigma regulatory factor (Ser/Thr protein kinase)/serine/threonine protein phosphatase PrpC
VSFAGNEAVVSLDQVVVRISDNTHVSEARRASVHMARDLAFDSAAEGNLAIVVTELARNVLMHGGKGEIVLQPMKESGYASWVDVVALDRGSGIADVSKALQDGYSSSGTPGTGLGAVRRLASMLDFYTRPQGGTVIFGRVVSGASEGAEKWQTTGSVCVPIAGETRCGDAWEYQDQSGRRLIMVADGLGHGAAASDAAQEALAAFRSNLHKSPKEIIEAAHGRLQKTRGAAVAVAEMDFERQVVHYAGVGNIAGAIVANGKSRSLVSHNGIVGHVSETIREFSFPWPQDAFLIMHSDGLTARWNLDQYQGLQLKPPSLIAAVLYRDFKRGRDDATVVVSREARAA